MSWELRIKYYNHLTHYPSHCARVTMFSTADGFDRHDPILQHDPVWREMCEWIEATLGQKNDDVWGELYVGGRYCFTFTDPKFITI